MKCPDLLKKLERDILQRFLPEGKEAEVMKFKPELAMNGQNRHYRVIKKALKKGKPVDPFMASKYHFSPYQACQHGCRYCDGRAEKYFVEGDFERDIVIRENIPELLKQELKKTRERGTIQVSSGISDAYQPVEADEKIMIDCANILAQSDMPVSVLTKSSLVERDIDLWEKVHQKNGFTLMISLIFANDEARKIFEPEASSVEQRLNTLKRFKERGFHVGVYAMPLLPGISDSDENLQLLLDKLSEIKVDFMVPGCLTLRPGRQKQLFLETIQRYSPHLSGLYQDLYRENRQSGMPIQPYLESISKRFNHWIGAYSIPTEIPHRIHKQYLSNYDSVFVLLNHMITLYSRRGINTENLAKSLNRYAEWLLGNLKQFNRKRSLPNNHVTQELISITRTGELEQILENSKLFQFLSKVILDDQTFDYVQLKLA